MRRAAGKRTTHRGFVLTFLAVSVLAFCLFRRATSPSTTHADGAADPALLDGRLWVDGRPTKPTDYVNAVFFVTDAELGAFQRGSSYDIHIELFDMTRDATTIRLTFPQSKRSATFRYSVRECRDRSPFDLCLDITSNPWGGPAHYYGFSRPEDERQALGALARDVRDRATRPPAD
jgi:hypothetical protein